MDGLSDILLIPVCIYTYVKARNSEVSFGIHPPFFIVRYAIALQKNILLYLLCIVHIQIIPTNNLKVPE